MKTIPDGEDLYAALENQTNQNTATVNLEQIQNLGFVALVEEINEKFVLNVYDDDNNIVGSNEITQESLDKYIASDNFNLDIIITGVEQLSSNFV